MSARFPRTVEAWSRLTDNWRRLWAQTFLGWALRASTDEVVTTMLEAMEGIGAPKAQFAGHRTANRKATPGQTTSIQEFSS